MAVDKTVRVRGIQSSNKLDGEMLDNTSLVQRNIIVSSKI